MERLTGNEQVIPEPPDLSPIKPLKEEMLTLATQSEEVDQHHATETLPNQRIRLERYKNSWVNGLLMCKCLMNS
jgi:hypothetical protein